jgi:hypothetical protein
LPSSSTVHVSANVTPLKTHTAIQVIRFFIYTLSGHRPYKQPLLHGVAGITRKIGVVVAKHTSRVFRGGHQSECLSI